MIYLILFLSLTVNGVFFWYIRKLIQKLSFGVNNVDYMQELLDEYSKSLEGMLQMEDYYGDETISIAVKNTRMIIEMCKGYKKTILVKEEQNSEQNSPESEG